MSSCCRAKLRIERCDFINNKDRNILPSSTTIRKVIVPSSIACGSVCSAERTCCYASFDRKTKQCNLDQSCCPQSEFLKDALMMKKSTVSLSCQNGWIQYETKCYFFSDSERSWNDAKIICENKDGMLAEVKSSCEKDFLKTTATAFALSFWLGGTDIQNEGDWIWTSSQTVVTFDDWTVDAPNNRFGNEHCLAIRKLNGFQWNDDDCSSSFRFICEKEIYIMDHGKDPHVKVENS
ncbi:low affinity immunoglobulin epsilon Fc receptor [Mytilus galloprovincialis]|uniref:Low affinity immunoglobulin epsilon Fc receptor n=1 Tax=Mytilus galloprovincialis TaxID=29158 RepID=A0A8B6BSB1_MYTGA|nr:low affinity immunoglobulin epsilon Fc receptor [Mytilus galloprovincialis]